MELIPAFYFDDRQLQPLAAQHRDRFLQAEPCQHVVIDDFLPLDILDRLIAEFPDWTHPRWEVAGAGRTKFSRSRETAKLHMKSDADYPPFIRHFLGQLNSAAFVRFVENLSGAKGLVVDPTYNGCGMHSTGRGGRLMLHTDMNRHPIADGQLHQILNLIIYLNRDWKDEYGGHLELWEKSPRRCVDKIAPLANRLVLFNTGTRALHGHPEPVAGPEGQRRNSLAVYYYTFDRPAGDDYEHFQPDVNWYPTAEEDFRTAREAFAFFRNVIAELTGRAMPLELAKLPSGVKTLFPLGDAASVFVFEWDEIAERERFLERHLRALVAKRDGTLGDLRPFGLIGVASASELMMPEAISCLVDNEGRIFLCNGPDAAQPVWVGYVGRFLKMLGVAPPP